MISRIKKSIELPAGDRRIAARMALAIVAAILCLTLVLAGASMGLTGSLAFSQPSPSGSPGASPSGPVGEPGKVFLLNPNPGYEPVTEVQEPVTVQPNPNDPTLDYPKMSDKFDGRDTAYHIVAAVKDPPSTALVEAYWQTGTANEVTIGQLSPVPGTPQMFELFWDIPSSMGVARGFLIVRLYHETPAGFEQLSQHSVEARVAHAPTTSASAAETVELTWPSPGGPLGFYKGAGTDTLWRTVASGTASGATDPNPQASEPGSTGTAQVRLFYSTTPIGAEPKFTQCGTGATSATPAGTRTFNVTCTLNAADRPSRVTALAAVAMQNHERSGGRPAYSQEAADVHLVAPYLQRVEDMKIDLTTSNASDSGTRRHIVQGSSTTGCLAYKVTVTDALDRPVQGANVDIHISGPQDVAQFGDDITDANTTASSGKRMPQKGHSTEGQRNCDGNNNFETQAEHNVPGANDIKHLESTAGTGISGGGRVTAGQWNFHIWSSIVGDTDIMAWIDDEPVATDLDKREADDDLPETSEKSDTNFAQWLPSAVTVSLDPLGATAAAGTCQRYIVRARAGTRAVRGANVDVHATGPTNDLDFCDPGDASPRRAPADGTGHNAEDEGEVAHAGQPPVAQHTEGVTNDQGNFVIGVMSPVPGDTTLTAWYDAGEDGFDNDNQDSGEANGSAITNWVESTADAAISFVNPSPYAGSTSTPGDGTRVARTQDVDSAFHVVARVASVSPVDGVEFFVRTGSGPLVKIGDGSRVGATDTYEVYWPVDVSDASHTLVARIANTNISVEQAVTVNNNPAPPPPAAPNPQDVPFETAEITAPLNGQRATFTNRRLTVKGVASAGAEGIDLYYTKASSLATPGASAWTSCGFVGLPAGSAPKEFTGECALQGGDQPGFVTGIAAITYDCTQSGCNAAPGAAPGGGRNPGEEDSGDAHRVFGVEANPLLAMEPAETAGDVDDCVKFVVSLTDQTGQPIPGQNLDAHLSGPGGGGNFCSPEDGTGTQRRAPNEGGHVSDGDEVDEAYHDEGGNEIRHTESDSTGNGRFVFGIESALAGDSQVTVWLDDDDDDVQDQGETTDVSIVHWRSESACDVTGTDGNDVLEGSDAAERICGFGGDDTILGGGGNDTILGGPGNDTMRGNAGDDRVNGGGGRDKVFGGGGEDTLSGGGGPDVVKGHRDDDRLRGNRGNDRLGGGQGRDDCRGGGGSDRLRKCETGTRSFAARTRPI